MGVTDGIRRDMRQAMNDAVEDLAHDVLRAAQADAPPSPPPGEDPHPEITLRERGYVERLPTLQEQAAYEIGFRAPYAAKVHEDFRLQHPRGGKPKYLERNVAAAAARMEGRIAASVRKVMAKRTSEGAPRQF